MIQFVPIIRHKVRIFHRINGYVVVLLLLLSNAGALMIVRRSFGGEMETQTFVGVLVIMTTLGAFMAYYNIKRLQVEQHRAWMLRTWFYAGSIITLRLIMIISALIISSQGDYYRAMPCSEIAFLQDSREAFEANFPQCSAINGTTVDRWGDAEPWQPPMEAGSRSAGSDTASEKQGKTVGETRAELAR